MGRFVNCGNQSFARAKRQTHMRSSYRDEDVTLLLKDITGLVKPQPTEERERLIQSGKHYSEMLPIEYVPTQKYMEVYREALEKYAGPTARDRKSVV